MIGVVSYGLGNIQAFVDIYRHLNMPVTVATSAEELAKADKIILPGVGAFDWAMERLNASGMRDLLDALVKVEKRPVLGVCVGMQIMARRSEEGRLPGLDWIPGDVRQLNAATASRGNLLPHMGWNQVAPSSAETLFRDIGDSWFYFLHSYYLSPDHPEHVLGATEYNGSRFAAAIGFGNVFGTQFHPEKSHGAGLALLKNFGEL